MKTPSFLSAFFAKKKIFYPVLALLVVLIAYISLNGNNGKQIITVKRGDIVQEVAATGKVKPIQSVDLAFDKVGRVENVFVEIGEEVVKGQTLASLDTGEVGADIAKAKAYLFEEEIKLRELKNTAPVSYGSAYKNLEASIKESFASADNAVRNRADQFFKNTSSNPQFEVSFTDGNYVHYFNVPSDTKIDINNSRMKVETILNDWQKRIAVINESNVLNEANLAIENLNTVSSFLDKVALAINTFTPAEYAYETTVNTYKTTISSARTEVSGAVSSLVTAKDKFNNAPTLGQSGQFESVLVQESKVTQARANLAALEASLGKSIIKAPFDGIVTLQDAKVGATVSAGSPVISMTSQNQMYVEANISEIHIGKIVQGNRVSITLDAFPDESFEGFVAYVEPGDVVIEGVVNYKIRVEFKNFDQRIKGGLTANLKIETSKKENVVSVPLYVITKEGDQNFVNKIVNQKPQKTEVSLGLSGNNGSVEILNGLDEGDTLEF